MTSFRHQPADGHRSYSYLAAGFLLAIIPVKLLRFIAPAISSSTATAIAPSFLGSGGLFFFLRSLPGPLGRLPLVFTAVLAALIATGLEVAQLLPRPGILARVHYQFDRFDVLAGLVGVLVALFLDTRFNRWSAGSTGLP